MRARPGLAGALGWAGGLVAAAVALHLSGKGALAGPTLADPGGWANWLAGRDPVIAAFALGRAAAVVSLWYLIVVTVVGLVLRLCGALRLVDLADRFTVTPVRRLLAATVGLGLAATGVVAVVAPAARLPVATAAQAATTSTAPPTGPGTPTMHQLSLDEAVPAPVAEAAAPPAGTPDQWTVRPGQCFWSIAERVLESRTGRPPTDAEVVPYWRRLIDANRDGLANRDDPDLIFPGQVFQVPAP